VAADALLGRPPEGRAKDLPLVDRPAGDTAEPVELLRRGLNIDHD